MDWSICPLVSIDPEIKHGAVVFKGTRFAIEDAIESVEAYQELDGLSEDQAIEETLKDHPTIPGAEALRTVLALEAAHEYQMAR
jgi:uncharacterized protein (DUF433 family)